MLSQYWNKVLVSLFCSVLCSSLFSEEKNLVCIHGFFRSKHNMVRIAHAFKNQNWNVINWGYASRNKMILDHSKDLVETLNHLVQEHPGKPIYFVTHSMGGLILRGALNLPNCPKEAFLGKIVLLAPPMRGSSMARRLYPYRIFRSIFGNYSGLELMTTLEDGFDKLGAFPNVPILILAGTGGCNPFIHGINDGKVSVEETQMSTPHIHRLVPHGHFWISYSSKVIHQIEEFFAQ